MKIRILFVCSGNICRSPAAEEIFKQKAIKRGVYDRFYIESAGINSYHKGELPDSRMRQYAARRGYKLTSISRPMLIDDFHRFDYIIDMDDDNRFFINRKLPDEETAKKLLRMPDYCSRHQTNRIPDPYYGNSKGFEYALDLLEDACDGLLTFLTQDK